MENERPILSYLENLYSKAFYAGEKGDKSHWDADCKMALQRIRKLVVETVVEKEQ